MNSLTRTAYTHNKKLAAVGEKIEKRDTVEAKKSLCLNHGIWLATKGAGFGKKQWT